MAGLRGARRMALRCSNSLLVALLFALPAAAHAQAYQCRAPQVARRAAGCARWPAPQPAGDRLYPRAQLVARVLQTAQGQPRPCRAMFGQEWQLRSCRPRLVAGKRAKLAAMVRGQGGAHPCRYSRGDVHDCPSQRLVARQWAKHGSCMVKRPASYLKVTSILWAILAHSRLRPHQPRGRPDRRPHPRRLCRCQSRHSRKRHRRKAQCARVARGSAPVLCQDLPAGALHRRAPRRETTAHLPRSGADSRLWRPTPGQRKLVYAGEEETP